MRRAAIVLVLMCSCRPSFPYTPNDKVAQVNDLDQLMWIQADTADPRFDIADDFESDPSKVTDAHFRHFIEMGERLTLAARRLPHFSLGDDFDRFAKDLGGQAKALTKSARASDAKASVSGVLSIRETCRGCHKLYK